MSVFSDAAKNVLSDGESSAMGYIILLTNGHVSGEANPSCPIYWKSTKCPRMINSIMEGEVLAMEEGLNIAYTLNKELAAITNIPEDLILVEALCDNDDAVKSVYSDKQNKKPDRVSWDVGRIRQMRMKKEIWRAKWLEGTDNIADVFTKKTAPKHLIMRALEHGLV